MRIDFANGVMMESASNSSFSRFSEVRTIEAISRIFQFSSKLTMIVLVLLHLILLRIDEIKAVAWSVMLTWLNRLNMGGSSKTVEQLIG